MRCGFSTCYFFLVFFVRQLFHEVLFFWAMAHLENRLNLYSSNFNGIFHALKLTAKATQKIGKKNKNRSFIISSSKKNICSRGLSGKVAVTLLETNISPENKQSQKETSIPIIHFQVLSLLVSGSVGFRKCGPGQMIL